MDFHGIDLNLLAAFDALMSERNVTRAAAQVGISQPAMSAALSRLRAYFGDPLFRRSAEGLLPTPRARELAEPIAQALHQIENALVEQPQFSPSEASMTFALGLSDYPALVLLPLVAQALEAEAPGVSLSVHTFTDRDNAVDLLDAGTVDAAIGVSPTHQDNRILTTPILRDEFVTIVRRDHPLARGGMDLDTYQQLRHVLISPEGSRYGVVDHALDQLGKHRTLALTLPQMVATPAVIARTDLTATVLKRVALHSAARRQLVLFPPPVALPTVAFELIWHRRHDAPPAQRWLRQRISELAAQL